MTKQDLLNNPALIRQLASGPIEPMLEAYMLIFGRDITHCKTCVQHDARFYLNRMATQIETGNTATLRVKAEYRHWESITGVGNIWPLTPEKAVAIQAAGFGKILEEIAPEPATEPATPADVPVVAEPVPAVSEPVPAIAEPVAITEPTPETGQEPATDEDSQ